MFPVLLITYVAMPGTLQPFLCDDEDSAMDSAYAARLRIYPFKREGSAMDSIAAEMGERFNVTADELKKRHRGNAVADARKALAFVATHDYRAPHRTIAGYLNVGNTAVSEMSHKGNAQGTVAILSYNDTNRFNHLSPTRRHF